MILTELLIAVGGLVVGSLAGRLSKSKTDLLKQYSTEEVPVVPYANVYGTFRCPTCEKSWSYIQHGEKAVSPRSCSCVEHSFKHFHIRCNNDANSGCGTKFIMPTKDAKL